MADILIRGMSVSNLIGKVIEIGYDAADCLYAFVDGGETDILDAVELPEHGELIDRDALPEGRLEWEDIDDAPVVVPADKEETE